MSVPYDFARAQEASHQAAKLQRDSETALSTAWKDYATAERDYRKGLAAKIVMLKAEGLAVTAAGDVARGDEIVAELKYNRDIAEGSKEAALQSCWRRVADRKDNLAFLEWSMRASFHTDPEPEGDAVTFGRRS